MRKIFKSPFGEAFGKLWETFWDPKAIPEAIGEALGQIWETIRDSKPIQEATKGNHRKLIGKKIPG